jgi:hypothetical protein
MGLGLAIYPNPIMLGLGLTYYPNPNKSPLLALY